jgi:hypothetical protein
MLSIFILGDGPLDNAMLPPIIKRILDVEINPEFKAWKDIRLNRKSSKGGYGAKLKYAVRRVKATDDLQSLVAVVDQDKDRKKTRIIELKEAREVERHQGIPTSVGQAIPHGEAWLIDDHEAVKKGLGLPADAQIPSVKKPGNPKSALNDVHQQHKGDLQSRKDAYACIAKNVRLSRCRFPEKTGFKEFVEDLMKEFSEIRAL